MIQVREISWWYWAVTAALLIVGLAGWPPAFLLAVGLSAIQIIHFRLAEGSWRAFPVQVRVAYFLILTATLWPPLHWLVWLPAIGTPAQVLIGYCLLARALSLLPWNRREPLSWDLVRRTFTTPPVKGNILQGQPRAA
jgi:hypothetical protein